MTREEANEILSDWALCHYTPSKEAAEAVISALDPLDIITALRGPTREMVERMFPGCAYCKLDSEGYVREFGSHYIWDGELKTEYCKPQKIKFCPHCSRPLTDEAVDMMLRRWREALDGEAD